VTSAPDPDTYLRAAPLPGTVRQRNFGGRRTMDRGWR
jgi:hypothetical protein